MPGIVSTSKRTPWYWFASFILLGLSAALVPYVILPALVSGFVLSIPWIVASIVTALLSITGLIYSTFKQKPSAPFLQIPDVVHQKVASFLSDADANKMLLLGRHFPPILQNKMQERRLIQELIQAIMKGNPKKVKELITKHPSLLFKQWSFPMTDPSGRKFMPTSALKLIFWLHEPMRDEVLACLPEHFKERVDQQKQEFMNDGLTYTVQSEIGVVMTQAHSKGYSLTPIITSLKDHMVQFNNRNLDERNQAWLAYGKLLRDIPYWVAQLIWNHSRPFSDLKTFDKAQFRANPPTKFNWFGSSSPLGVEFSFYWSSEYQFGHRLGIVHPHALGVSVACFESLQKLVDTDANHFMPSAEEPIGDPMFTNPPIN